MTLEQGLERLLITTEELEKNKKYHCKEIRHNTDMMIIGIKFAIRFLTEEVIENDKRL